MAANNNTHLLGPYQADIPDHQIPFFSDINYADKIGNTLLEMPLGCIFDIASKVRIENREKFINIVKTYIDYGFGNPDWKLEFNSDYSRIKKVQTIHAMLADINESKNGRQRQRNWRDEYDTI